MTLLFSSSYAQDVREESRWLAALEWTLAGAVAAFQIFIAPHEIWGDGGVRYDTLVQLVDKGKVTASIYSIIHSFLAAPLYVLGKLFGRGQVFVSYFNVLLFHLTLFLLYRMLRRHLPAPILRRTILLLLAASMFGNHVQTFYGEVLTACAAILGFSALAINRPTIAGLAMCVSVVNTPVAGLGLVLCNGWWALRTRRWFHATWPVVVSLVLIALEFWWRRGSPTRTGYDGAASLAFTTIMPYSGRPGFGNPLPLGVLSLLFSFGKGIVFFAPGLLLYHVATPSKRDPVVSMLGQLGMAFSWGMLLIHASWCCWHGAWFWGPRYLLVACLPASFALARHVSDSECRRAGVTLLTVCAIIWSAWVGINGTVIREIEADICTLNRFNLEALCWYVPEFSELIHPLIVKTKVLTAWDKTYILLGASVAVVLIVPMLAARFRNFAVRALARSR